MSFVLFGLFVGVPLLIVLSLAAPVWLRTHSWSACLRAVAVSLFGVVLPVAVFLLSGFFQPEWKGGCAFGWVDCFHQGKWVLLPVVLWAVASLYWLDGLRLGSASTRRWVRWGLFNGAVVSTTCLLQGLATAHREMIWPLGWGFLVPAFTTVWYTWRSWQLWRAEPWPLKQAGIALLPALPFWVGSVVASRWMYERLPNERPGCFVVTAASRGHPWVVGSGWAGESCGGVACANAQLRNFRAFEAACQVWAPASHAVFRRVYNVWGARMAGWIRDPWTADVVYLLLKPVEWMALALLRFSGRPALDSGPALSHIAMCENAAIHPQNAWRRWLRWGTATAWAAVAVYFFLIPGIIVSINLCDPALREPGIPRQAWRLHRVLTPRFTAWARERIESGRAAHLALHDVPSTEWPLFSSVFYLWATEALQADWDRQDPGRRGTAPAIAARPAIDAAIALVLDPAHHTWVRQHWGDDYLHNQNCFFRSLLISGITSYTHLTGDRRHLPLLRDQVTTLAASLDASPVGLLEDYPGECYPIDVVCSVACLQRAAALLGMDLRDFVARERRAFTGPMLDSHGLPPYVADWRDGRGFDCSRGTGNSHTLLFAPELWPDLARDWYAAYDRAFWQDRGWAAGFREYPRDAGKPETFFEIDAGPVIAGFSPAANAFGLAATRRNGRFDHARTLGAQIVAASWPLPNGTLLGCRILSAVGGKHAPYLGETALLFHLTQNPAPGIPITRGGRTPPLVWGLLAFYFGIGGWMLARAVRLFRKEGSPPPVLGDSGVHHPG